MGEKEYRDLVAIVREKLHGLSHTSPIRTLLTNPDFEQAMCEIEKAGRQDRLTRPATFGFLLNFLVECLPEAIDDFDNDLALVLQHTPLQNASTITQFLLSKTSDASSLGMWYGRLFDVWVRAVLLKNNLRPEFDAPLPNGRDSDVRVKINGRFIRLENTAITEGESRQGREEAVHNRRLRWINLYSRPRRIYQKVYEKIAKDLDPDNSQCSQSEPNVLLMALSGPDMEPAKPGWNWALDRLFNVALEPSEDGPQRGRSDISLRGWLQYCAGELCARNRFTEEDFNQRYERLLDAPNYLGGLILFRYCHLSHARVNYHAHDECRLSHAEMAQLERLFGTPPSYSLA